MLPHSPPRGGRKPQLWLMCICIAAAILLPFEWFFGIACVLGRLQVHKSLPAHYIELIPVEQPFELLEQLHNDYGRDWRLYNVAVIERPDFYLAFGRVSDAHFCTGEPPERPTRSFAAFARFDKRTLKICKGEQWRLLEPPMDMDDQLRSGLKFVGYEEPRPAMINNTIYTSGSWQMRVTGKPSWKPLFAQWFETGSGTSLQLIRSDFLLPADTEQSAKNWAPFAYQNSLYVFQDAEPLTVCKWNGSACEAFDKVLHEIVPFTHTRRATDDYCPHERLRAARLVGELSDGTLLGFAHYKQNLPLRAHPDYTFVYFKFTIDPRLEILHWTPLLDHFYLPSDSRQYPHFAFLRDAKNSPLQMKELIMSITIDDCSSYFARQTLDEILGLFPQGPDRQN